MRDADLWQIPKDVRMSPRVILNVLGRSLREDLSWVDYGLQDEMLKLARRGAQFLHRQTYGSVRFKMGHRTFVVEQTSTGGPFQISCVEGCRDSQERCGARLAMGLVWLWMTSDKARTVLTTEPWRMAVGPLVRVESPIVGSGEGGGLIYVLRDPTATDAPGFEGVEADLGVRRLRSRHSEKTGKALKPAAAPFGQHPGVWSITPKAGDEVVAHAFRMMTALMGAVMGGTAGRPRSAEAAQSVDEALHGLYRSLSGVSEVRLHTEDGSAVQVDLTPLSLSLSLAESGTGLSMAWTPEIHAVYPAHPPWILTSEGRFSPASPQSAAVIQRAGGLPPLTEIPADQINIFVTEALPKLAIPVDLTGTELVVKATQVPMRPVVLLSAEGRALVVEVRAAYQFEGREILVDPAEPGSVLTFEGADGLELVQRQRAEEATASEQVSQWAGALPARLDGEAVYDFLFEGVNALEQAGFELRGSTSLTGKVHRAAIRPQVRMASGVDWFDVKIDFEADGERVPLKAIVKAHEAGERYHTLSGGRVVRLPEAWLNRHGHTLKALSDLQQQGKVGSYAAPLVAELVDDASDLSSTVRAQVREWRGRINTLTDLAGVPDRAVDRGFRGTLRDYQHQGYRWITFLKEIGFGGVLADDMGLGKTVQVLAALQWAFSEKGRKAPALVVAPTSVVYNWAQEAARFTPGLKVKVHHGRPRAEDARALIRGAQVVITSYPIIRQDAELFSRVKWGALIFDEAQAIKNPSSQVAQTMRTLTAPWRLALTGTPIENNLMELWSLFEVLMPGFFGSQQAFKRHYVKPIQNDQDEEAMATLRQRIRPFILRRLKSEVALELPPRTEQVLYCELPPSQRQVYDGVRESWRDRVMQAVADKGMGRSTLEILEALMRLRQAACDLHLLPDGLRAGAEGAAKLELLDEILEPVVAEGHKALVFSQWPSLLKRVIPRLEAQGIDYLYLDGSTSDRQDLVNRFNTPEGPPIFLISLKAGGTGLNLTAADHVIHLDPWWNPAAEAQATDRAYRIGQTRPVTVYKLVARGTVEEKILELQARKRALFEAAVDEGRVMVDALSQADLEAVFSDMPVSGPPLPLPEPQVIEAEEKWLPPAETPRPAPVEEAPLKSSGQGVNLPAPLYERLQAHGHITLADVIEVLWCSDGVAKARIKGWVSKGWLQKTGRGAKALYFEG
ncbi:MAG: DEAD/DEAH box helicase [Bradymonadia bacterium]